MTVNAHIHITDYTQIPIETKSNTLFFINGTTTDDAEFFSQFSACPLKGARPALFSGIHPWFCADITEEQAYLFARQQAEAGLNIGEIGLDKVKTDKKTRSYLSPDKIQSYSTQFADFNHQKKVFTAQCRAAATTDAAISLHCVRATGSVLETLRAAFGSVLDRPVMIHDCRPNHETLKDFIKAGIFISLAPQFFDKPQNAEILRKIPPQLLLIEDEQMLHNPQRLERSCRLTSKITGIDITQLKELFYKNGQIFQNKNIAWR